MMEPNGARMIMTDDEKRLTAHHEAGHAARLGQHAGFDADP